MDACASERGLIHQRGDDGVLEAIDFEVPQEPEFGGCQVDFAGLHLQVAIT